MKKWERFSRWTNLNFCPCVWQIIKRSRNERSLKGFWRCPKCHQFHPKARLLAEVKNNCTKCGAKRVIPTFYESIQYDAVAEEGQKFPRYIYNGSMGCVPLVFCPLLTLLELFNIILLLFLAAIGCVAVIIKISQFAFLFKDWNFSEGSTESPVDSYYSDSYYDLTIYELSWYQWYEEYVGIQNDISFEGLHYLEILTFFGFVNNIRALMDAQHSDPFDFLRMAKAAQDGVIAGDERKEFQNLRNDVFRAAVDISQEKYDNVIVAFFWMLTFNRTSARHIFLKQSQQEVVDNSSDKVSFAMCPVLATLPCFHCCGPDCSKPKSLKH